METITAYERRYRRAVLDLLFYSHRTHTHLDWHDVGQWLDLDEAVVRLLWRQDQLVAVMGFSKPLYRASWLRLAAVANPHPARPALIALWRASIPALREKACDQIGVLLVDNWLEKYLADLAFSFEEYVVTLRRRGFRTPPLHAVPLSIRSAELEDLDHMLGIDHRAFSPPWQLSREEIRQAMRVAALATVAQLQDQIVGYQISTLYHQSGHLARLGVEPTFQGRGVGGSILHDLIQRFLQRGVRILTVNTQSRNLRSQRLYVRYGFQRSNYDLPVWMAHLAGSDDGAGDYSVQITESNDQT